MGSHDFATDRWELYDTRADPTEAHDLAEDATLNGTLGELRTHIRNMVPRPPLHAETKGVLLGVVSGILTHYLLDSLHRGHKEC